MEESEKKRIVREEAEKKGITGEGAGGSGHLASMAIKNIHVGKDTSDKEKTWFDFSIEVERMSEFGTQLYWYSGEITVYQPSETSLGKVISSFNMHDSSHLETMVPPNQMDMITEIVEKVRKELKLI
ncbi:hypothetical protein ACFLZN_01940 [Nanoarchaeota archaeon]